MQKPTYPPNAYLRIRGQPVPAAEHGREHAVAVGEGRARRSHVLAANVEVDGVGGARVVVGHERGLAMPVRPVQKERGLAKEVWGVSSVSAMQRSTYSSIRLCARRASERKAAAAG